MGRVLFKGGPCDTRAGDYDDASLGTGTLLCGGVVYHLYLVSEGNYLALMPGVKPPHDFAGQDAPDVYQPDQALKAWRFMQDAAGRRLPAHVNTTKALRYAIRRAGKR